MDIALTKKQAECLTAKSKFINIWEGAVRSGKSFGSLFGFAREALIYSQQFKLDGYNYIEHGRMLITGRTLNTIDANILQILQGYVGTNIFQYNLNDGVGKFGTIDVRIIGGDKESKAEDIKGLTANLAYDDETTSRPKRVFDMIVSRLSVKHKITTMTEEMKQLFDYSQEELDKDEKLISHLVCATNPDNPKHFLKTEYIDRPYEWGLQSFKFTIDDNTTLPPEYIQRVKNGYTGIFYQRFIQGLWVAGEGMIYDFFEERFHTRDIAELPKGKYKLISIDYGITNPTSIGLYVLPDDTKNQPVKVWREKGWYYKANPAENKRFLTDSEIVDAMFDFIAGEGVVAIIIDPSAASLKAEISRQFMKRGKFLPIIDADNEVEDGIRTQANMLKNGQYVIARTKSNKQCIDDYYLYAFDLRKAQQGIDAPVKENDHTKDEERYLLNTYFGADPKCPIDIQRFVA
jgi:PBSX family phage terminase large subunit